MVAAPAGPYTFARAQKIIVYFVTLPYNALVKNFREDQRAGSASFFWKYPLFVGAACYPIGYYRHESKFVRKMIICNSNLYVAFFLTEFII